MNCIVTAGPTCEPLDQVRRLTNLSTGRLGTELANYLAAQGQRVVLLRSRTATYSREGKFAQVVPFTTTAELQQGLQSLASAPVGAVFHAAAVSDFGFGKVFRRLDSGELIEMQAGKISTREGALLAELTPTPKIISQLRSWFPKAQLAGWKYEVDGTRPDALQAGADQIRQYDTDLCVVNGPAYGAGFGLLTREAECCHLAELADLFEALGRWASTASA